eukprot:6148051-Karenia_brevis.AAC.1
MVDFGTLLLIPEDGTAYNLRGVIEHHGAHAGSGHYTSYVRTGEHLWYHCDDEQGPQQVSTERVLSAQAYVNGLTDADFLSCVNHWLVAVLLLFFSTGNGLTDAMQMFVIGRQQVALQDCTIA